MVGRAMCDSKSVMDPLTVEHATIDPPTSRKRLKLRMEELCLAIEESLAVIHRHADQPFRTSPRRSIDIEPWFLMSRANRGRSSIR